MAKIAASGENTMFSAAIATVLIITCPTFARSASLANIFVKLSSPTKFTLLQGNPAL